MKKVSIYISMFLLMAITVFATCVDSDGENINTPGIVTYNGFDYPDVCNDAEYITETICVNGVVETRFTSCGALRVCTGSSYENANVDEPAYCKLALIQTGYKFDSENKKCVVVAKTISDYNDLNSCEIANNLGAYQDCYCDGGGGTCVEKYGLYCDNEFCYNYYSNFDKSIALGECQASIGNVCYVDGYGRLRLNQHVCVNGDEYVCTESGYIDKEKNCLLGCNEELGKCNSIIKHGSDEICDNLVDDDGDGLIDLSDPDCQSTECEAKCDAMNDLNPLKEFCYVYCTASSTVQTILTIIKWFAITVGVIIGLWFLSIIIRLVKKIVETLG